MALPKVHICAPTEAEWRGGMPPHGISGARTRDLFPQGFCNYPRANVDCSRGSTRIMFFVVVVVLFCFVFDERLASPHTEHISHTLSFRWNNKLYMKLGLISFEYVPLAYERK